MSGLGWWLYRGAGALRGLGAAGGAQALLKRAEAKAEITLLLRRGCFLLPNGRVIAGDCTGALIRHGPLAKAITGDASGYRKLLEVGTARVAFNRLDDSLGVELQCGPTRFQLETLKFEWQTFHEILVDFTTDGTSETYDGTGRGWAKFEGWAKQAAREFPCGRR